MFASFIVAMYVAPMIKETYASRFTDYLTHLIIYFRTGGYFIANALCIGYERPSSIPMQG